MSVYMCATCVCECIALMSGVSPPPAGSHRPSGGKAPTFMFTFGMFNMKQKTKMASSYKNPYNYGHHPIQWNQKKSLFC